MLLETGQTGTQAVFALPVPDGSAWSRLVGLAGQAWGAWESILSPGSCQFHYPQPLPGLYLNRNQPALVVTRCAQTLGAVKLINVWEAAALLLCSCSQAQQC